MAGLTAGYFPAAYFTHDYWQLSSQYWTEHGVAVAAVASPSFVTPVKKRRRRRRVSVRLLQLFKAYLEMKQN